jgi:hypothetical protein
MKYLGFLGQTGMFVLLEILGEILWRIGWVIGAVIQS